jgi:hypothetical protein
MDRNSAETTALKALGWLAAQDDLFATFLSASGASLADVRRQAGEPALLTAMLAFLMQSDAWVLDFASASAIRPEAVAQALALLGGPAAMNWA